MQRNPFKFSLVSLTNANMRFMDDFKLYFLLGLKHVLDLAACDHILFLIVLTVVFSFYQYKKVIGLLSFFTIGHTITLALAVYGVMEVEKDLVEFLIPVTIAITGGFNILRAKRAALGKQKVSLFFALFFGLIHGLGFSNYFRGMIGKEENKMMPLLEFALGIEISQVIVVSSVLLVGMLLKWIFNVSKRDWILVCSSMVTGRVLPMVIERVFW